MKPNNHKAEKQNFWRRLYALRARWEDWRIGKTSMEGIRPARFRAQGG